LKRGLPFAVRALLRGFKQRLKGSAQLKARHLLAVSLFFLLAVPVLSVQAQTVRSLGIARNPAVSAANRAQADWRNGNPWVGSAASPGGASAPQAGNGSGNNTRGNRGGYGVGFVPLPPAH
jgi:hypothetical protein